ncbi:MAG: MBL fold metallo-hydrolase [bacterium]|nr:MAG: MBL fold metallo-hydrolase [bacterium]
MPTNPGNTVIDPKFPKYVYASKPLVPVYSKVKKGEQRATLFIGEWMKILDDPVPKRGRVHVRYRGGKGYVSCNDYTYSRMLEVFFIDVDQGDSILIQTPDDRRILIDGGESDDAHTFIRDKYNLYEKENYIDFEAMIATHSDADHTSGLIKILKDPKIAVKRFYHNGLFRRTVEASDPGPVIGNRIFSLVDRPGINAAPPLSYLMRRLVKAVEQARTNMPKVIGKMKAQERWKGRIDAPPGGFVFARLDASDRYLPPYDDKNSYLTVEVLWPAARKVNGRLSYSKYGDAGKTVNGNSIVLCLKHKKKRILLTGDLNEKAMDDILKRYGSGGKNPSKRLRADVYKAAHHGSQHFSVPFLKAVKPNAAVVSSGDNRYDKHGHPRAILMGTITRYSRKSKPAVFSTELAACFRRIPMSKKKRRAFMEGRSQIYEKAIMGIVHLRSDGKNLYLGTVHGRKPPEKRFKNIRWKWDIWPEI